MKRVVYTVAVGAPRYAEMALGLARSLSLQGDATPRIVASDIDDPRLSRWFSAVVPPRQGVPTYLQKLQAFQQSDADAALFIDSDSLVFGRLDPIWEACRGKPVAVLGYWQSEGQWYGPLAPVLPKIGVDAIPHFNGGMIYTERGPAFDAVVAEALEVAANYGDLGLDFFRGNVPDEPCLSIAMARTGHGHLIPDDCDFMNTPVGLIGPLSLSVMKGECRFIKRGRTVRLIRPIIFHAAKYVTGAAYWRELAVLEWLDQYEQKHPYGYMSPAHKLRRSLERRILRLKGKL